MGQPLVVFATPDGPAVLHDRCPHRGVPLSAGRLREAGTIACAYHGWRFDGRGRCVEVPGSTTVPAVCAEPLPAIVRAGLVWTSLATEPAAFPTLPSALEDEALDRFWWLLKPSPAGLLDALENHLDPGHPHHIHPWLVRSPGRRRATKVSVRSGPWGAEAVYAENRRTRALLPLMEGDRRLGVGRLHPPTLGEVRLEAARGLSLSIAVVFAPEDAGLVRPWAHFATRRGLLPAAVKRALLKAFHLPILNQDRRILALQVAARARSGGLPLADGPLDLLGPTIRRLAEGLEEPERAYEVELML